MSLRSRGTELRLGLMLLTRLPAGRLSGPVPQLGASAWAWPFAGLAVGVLAALGFGLARWMGLSVPVAAGIAVAAGVLATGGMHEDGFADLADGCGGGGDRARRLEIMRDSRLGSYGMLALALALGLRGTAICQIAENGAGNGSVAVALALIGLAMASRAGMTIWVRVLPPARDDGLGRASSSGVSTAAMAVALALGVLALSPLGGAGVAAMGAVLVGGALVAGFAWHRLGGQTGDVLGSTQLVAEICGLLTLSALS